MATSTANGSAADLNGGTVKGSSSAGQQQPSRAPVAAKMSDTSRKENDDGTARRPPQPRAWTQGVNPITQRSNTPSSTNGSIGKPHSRNTSSQDPKASDRLSLDRQTSYMAASVGLECKIHTRAGESFSGIFAGSAKVGEDYKLLFKMVKALSPGPHGEAVNGAGDEATAELTGFGQDHSMVFPINSIASMDLPEIAPLARAATPNGVASSFRTDTDISGATLGRERGFQRWEAPADKPGVDMSLESAGDWDQFEANEKKFGIKSTFDENLYTTAIDRSNPLYQIREREAARLAREIETDTSGNAHMREERGHKDDGADEEEKYSGVRRNGADHPLLQSTQPNRYMPPARRAQAGVPNATDGPVDPAIISSQIARPEQADSPKKAEHKGSAKQELAVEPKADVKASVASKDTKPLRQPVKTGATATENVETEVLDSFRQFAANEKIKVQDHKRSRASAEKSVKLNDLKKFSQNFKLLTPVPNDLVPILARDEGRQKEIVQLALKNCNDSQTATKGALMDPKTQRPLAAARLDREAMAADAKASSRARHEAGTHAGAPKDRQQQTRDLLQGRPAPLGLGGRLAESHKQHKQGMMAAIPQPLPIQEGRNQSGRSSAFQSALSSPQKAGSIRGPPSATSSKFNVKAMEFKPNPAANTFQPTTRPAPTATPPTPHSGSVTRTISPSGVQPKFFGEKKKFGKPGERPDPISLVAPKKPPLLEAEESKDGHKEDSSVPVKNGGFKFPHMTRPTWNPPPNEKGEETETEMKYWEVFDKARLGRQQSAQGKVSPVNPAAAHQHQLPFHLQNGPNAVPQLQTPQPIPQPMPSQPHHFPHGAHFDEHPQRQHLANAPGYHAPSPRMQSGNMAGFHSPMMHHAQPAAYGGQPVPYLMHAQPGPMSTRQFSAGGGPQMMQMQMQPSTHLAPVMMQQQSSSGYVTAQPMPMQYSHQGVPVYAGPAPAMYATPSQPPSGYPSPGRGVAAPMMIHQGSHQGHPQGPVFVQQGQYPGQPMYPQQPQHMGNIRAGFGSPQPPFHQGPYPQQHQQFPHRTPSAGYVQPHQPHHPHAVPQQQQQQAHPPPATGPAEMGGDEAK